jgi:hypothetical protein
MTHVLPTDADNSSNRPPLDGGSNAGAGPLLGDAIHTPNSNIIEFPSGRAFLPDSRAKERELSIRDLVVIGFVCVTATWVGCLIGAGLYIGKLIVAYLSNGA